MSARMKPLVRRTVTWHTKGDPAKRTNVASYVEARHPDDLPLATRRNEMVADDLAAYNDACQMGKAVIVSSTSEEVDDGAL